MKKDWWFAKCEYQVILPQEDNNGDRCSDKHTWRWLRQCWHGEDKWWGLFEEQKMVVFPPLINLYFSHGNIFCAICQSNCCHILHKGNITLQFFSIMKTHKYLNEYIGKVKNTKYLRIFKNAWNKIKNII